VPTEPAATLLQRLKIATRDHVFPKYSMFDADKKANPGFVDSAGNNLASSSKTRWDLFLAQQNPDGGALDVSMLFVIAGWTGLSKLGFQELQKLADNYGNQTYLTGRNFIGQILKEYPETVTKTYSAFVEEGISTSPQPAIYGYSASDVAKLTDQAINLAAMDYARGNVRLPTDGKDVCGVAKLGVLEAVPKDQCARDGQSTCCQLLPSDGRVCEIKSVEQRSCIRTNRITLKNFADALQRFTSTVNAPEYEQTVEYYLSRGTVEPGSQQ